MATGGVRLPQPPLAAARRGLRGRGVLHRRLAASPMKDESVVPTNGGKEEMAADSLNVSRGVSHPGLSSSIHNQPSMIPTPLLPAEPSDLRFNRLRPSIDESDCKYKRFFGCYVAREAIIDEEYWVSILLPSVVIRFWLNILDSTFCWYLDTASKSIYDGLIGQLLYSKLLMIAAWLRAEDHYEDQSGDRYVESFKRKFASQQSHHLIAGISCLKEAMQQAAGREVYLFCCGKE